MTLSVHELGYLGFDVSDMPRWERFATEVLGVGVSRGPQDTLRLRLDAAPARFILRQGGANDFAFAGWKLVSAADVEAFARQLDSRGIKGTWGTDDELAVRHADLGHIQQTFTIGEADIELAEKLSLHESAPVAELRRIVRNSSGTIVYFGHLFFRGDLVRLDFSVDL